MNHTLYTRGLSHVLERSIFLVVQQDHATREADRNIYAAIVVIVANGTTDPMQARVESGLLGIILKLAITQIAIKTEASFWAIIGDKDVWLSISAIVQKARAWPYETRQVFCT